MTARLFLLLGLLPLAGCLSHADVKTLQDIGFAYHGSVRITSQLKLRPTPGQPWGRYLNIAVQGDSLTHRFGSARLPASNCALLAFGNLAPTGQDHYDYYRVLVADADTAATYTFAAAELTQALRARPLAEVLLASLQQHNYLTAVNACNPAAYGPVPPDSLLARFRRLPRQLPPFNTYAAQGYRLDTVLVAGRPQPLVRFVLSVPRYHVDQPPGLLAVLVNPQMKPTEKFLYGTTVLR